MSTRQAAPMNRRALVPLAILAALAARPGPLAAQATAPVPVTASTVIRRPVQAGQSFVGTAEPRRLSVVSSAVEQRVEDYPINEGDRVEKGQVLARLRTRPTEIALNGARAQLAALEQELAELKHGSRPEEIERGRAALARAEAMRAYNRLRRNRLISLHGSNTASREEVDEAIAQAEQAEQAFLEAKASLDLLEKGTREEQIAQAEARRDAQIEEVRRLEDNLAEHTIVAPFDGYVVAEHTEVGQWVAKGSPVAEIVELDEVDVTVQVLEDYVRYLHAAAADGRRPGSPARVELNALPDQAFTGEVVHIVPKADARSRTFPVKVRLENRERDGVVLIKAGMFASVTLPVGPRREALLVPKDSLVLGGVRPLIYVVDYDPKDTRTGKVRPVEVTLGVAEEALIQVESPDLQENDTIVVQGNERLRPGQEVLVGRIVEPPPVTSR
jgi:HlyD family secretion protein